MDTSTLFKSAYEKLWSVIAEGSISLPGRFLPYDHPSESEDMIYSLQEVEFTRELLNSINQFSARLNQIVLWEEVLSNYDEDQARELRFEFTSLLLYYCLHQPYEFRSRLIFAATQLCYTHGIDRNLLNKNDVSKDDDINYASLNKVAIHWRAGTVLLEAIRGLNGGKFREGTNNYRNRAQHRVAPGIDHGHTNVIERTFSPGVRVEYIFGEAAPLATGSLVPLLVVELNLMIGAFEAYRRLVDEHTTLLET
jgi:hypothetical protein